MPEFILPISDRENWRSYSPFVQGYLEAMFFTDGQHEGDSLFPATVEDLAPETVERICWDCFTFVQRAAADLDRARMHASVQYDQAQAGRDFWFTRNGHGVGFWDRGLGDVGNNLSAIAETFGEMEVYLGDDGKIYA